MRRGPAFVTSVAIAATTMQVSFLIFGEFGPVDFGVAEILLFEWLAAFILIAFATAIPALGTAALLDRGVRWPLAICVGAALLTAAVFTVLGTAYMTQPDGDPDRLTFTEGLGRFARWTLPAGFTGGLTFWRFAFRRSTKG